MRDSALTEYDAPRPRLTGDERRRTILEAARSEFARVGYYGASTASIARVAGCSEPMLYKHFAGKLDLFTQALADAIQRAYGTFSQYAAAGGDISMQSRTYIEHTLADPAYLELTKLRRIALTVDEPPVQDMLREMDRRLVEEIRSAIRVGVEQGVTRPDVDPDFVAFCWLGFMQAASYREVLYPGAFRDSARHIAAFMRALDTQASPSDDDVTP